MLGWLLAGINQHSALKDSWVFKGGTCLKKCYFETYRFSEDLDFTLRDPSHIDEKFLRETFESIGEWIYENAGIEVPASRLMFEVFPNPRGKNAAQGRVFYRGPVTPSGNQAMPRIKLDLTADEVLADTPVECGVAHGYSDTPPDGIHILSYSYAEVFAEKIRALKERTRPRDLYDVVNFFRRPESRNLGEEVRILLQRKCDFKGITFPVIGDLDDHKNICESGWLEQLGHQLQSLPPFESFWGELPDFFTWLIRPEETTTALAPIPFATDESSNASLLGTNVSTQYFTILDRIRFAAVNRVYIELDYRKEDGRRKTYLIEPYSLRRTIAGNIILRAAIAPATDSSIALSFRVDRMIGARITEQAFTPRHAIDFIPAGPMNM